jgi:hypothetical protein
MAATTSRFVQTFGSERSGHEAILLAQRTAESFAPPDDPGLQDCEDEATGYWSEKNEKRTQHIDL